MKNRQSKTSYTYRETGLCIFASQHESLVEQRGSIGQHTSLQYQHDCDILDSIERWCYNSLILGETKPLARTKRKRVGDSQEMEVRADARREFYDADVRSKRK